jgi:hypothetical protein
MILGTARRPRPTAPDVVRQPEPDDRPDPHAQWDEVKGEWVVWHEDTDEWEALADDTSPEGGTET